MECELCGKSSYSLKEVNVDGVKFMVCEQCAIPYEKKPSTQKFESHEFIPKGKKIRNFIDSQEFHRINLISEWGKLIRKKREEQGLTIEELAEKIIEKESTINKLDNEKTIPSKQLIEKIEKFFSIKLIDENENDFVQEKKEESQGFTLMDFVKKK